MGVQSKESGYSEFKWNKTGLQVSQISRVRDGCEKASPPRELMSPVQDGGLSPPTIPPKLPKTHRGDRGVSLQMYEGLDT